MPFGINFVNFEIKCSYLAQEWINCNDLRHFRKIDIEYFYDLQKIYFLDLLRTSGNILGAKKMHYMAKIYKLNNQNDEIR